MTVLVTVSKRQGRTDRSRVTAESARGGRFRWHVPFVELDDICGGAVTTWNVRVIDVAVNSQVGHSRH